MHLKFIFLNYAMLVRSLGEHRSGMCIGPWSTQNPGALHRCREPWTQHAQSVADLGQRGICRADLVMASSPNGGHWGHQVIIKEPSPAQTICWGIEGN